MNETGRVDAIKVTQVCGDQMFDQRHTTTPHPNKDKLRGHTKQWNYHMLKKTHSRDKSQWPCVLPVPAIAVTSPSDQARDYYWRVSPPLQSKTQKLPQHTTYLGPGVFSK